VYKTQLRPVNCKQNEYEFIAEYYNLQPTGKTHTQTQAKTKMGWEIIGAPTVPQCLVNV